MAPDFRSDRMDSAEGRGRARRAWDAYVRTVERVGRPVLESAAKSLSAKLTAELSGFWLSWHLYGGFEGLERIGWKRSTIYRKLKLFRTVLGVHPDDYDIVGVDLDRQAFWDHYFKPTVGSEES